MKRKVKCPECGYQRITIKRLLNDICPDCNLIMETVRKSQKREYTIEEVKVFETDEHKKCHCRRAAPIRENDIDPYFQEYFWFECLHCGSYSDCFFEGEKIEEKY